MLGKVCHGVSGVEVGRDRQLGFGSVVGSVCATWSRKKALVLLSSAVDLPQINQPLPKLIKLASFSIRLIVVYKCILISVS